MKKFKLKSRVKNIKDIQDIIESNKKKAISFLKLKEGKIYIETSSELEMIIYGITLIIDSTLMKFKK